jgi:hypothetical protein
MRTMKLLSLSFLALLSGCATFKELEPEPPISPQERGFIELKNDEDVFQLAEGERYFIRFPGPAEDNYTLVLQTSAAWYINAYMTRSFDDGKEPIVPMEDDAPITDSTSVYAIDTASPTYFWVIDTVRQDVDLRMDYRYVPRWRYAFEKKYVEFKATLAGNRVDRSTYTGSGNAPSIEAVDFTDELAVLRTRTEALSAMQGDLKEVAKLFPPGIAAANDTAYQNYTLIRAAVDDELQFQANYAKALSIFKKEKLTRNRTGEFLQDAPEYVEFLSQGSRYPATLVARSREVIGNRLDEIIPYYEKQLQEMKEPRPGALKPPIETVRDLFRACNRPVPPEFETLSGFVRRFDLEMNALSNARERLREMNDVVSRTASSPALEFYANMEGSAADIRASVPQPEAAANPRYGAYPVVQSAARELGEVTNQADDLTALFASGRQIAGDIGARSWGSAERKTADLFYGRDGRSYASASHLREKLVKWFEADIFNGVQTATKERLDGFVKSSQGSYTNVPALYADSAFKPAYVLGFSSVGEGDLAQKRSQIEGYITRVRTIEFPEGAIRLHYADFTRDINANGVERARAIVEHGKIYKGNDKQISSILNECDPAIAKWIVRPKEYRRLLAFPVTTNKRGENEYMFRIKLQIPSDAQFPVFDVNIKLPKEIAEAAKGESWYEQITINKNLIKNEGRFRITAPLPDNNYESQITPVQMDKAGNNILEVRFKKASFKVYEISAMAQVPIMKKN